MDYGVYVHVTLVEFVSLCVCRWGISCVTCVVFVCAHVCYDVHTVYCVYVPWHVILKVPSQSPL